MTRATAPAPLSREEIEQRVDEFLAALRRVILLLVDAIQARR